MTHCYVKIAHRSVACSTLVIGGFLSNNKTFFIKNLKEQIKEAATATESIYDPYSGPSFKVNQKILDGHPVTSYAFFYLTFKTGSNSSIYETQGSVESYLKELGFTVANEGTYNSKNGTSVKWAIAPVNVVLKNLSKYDDKGDPIEVKKEVSPIIKAEEKKKRSPRKAA